MVHSFHRLGPRAFVNHQLEISAAVEDDLRMDILRQVVVAHLTGVSV